MDSLPDYVVIPPGSPMPDSEYPRQKCPHCGEQPFEHRMDQHIRDVHGDLPQCTARIDGEYGAYTCAFRVGHAHGEYGDRHAGFRGPHGRFIWADYSPGAVPHIEQPAS